SAAMSDNQNFGFGKFVPGFDFLQNLAKGASQTLPQMPNLSNWVAPTLNLEELEKRIGELKAVHFWLDQNSKALGATIQALEVQKMTLATLRGMNLNMAELAESLKMKTSDAMEGMQKMAQAAGEAAQGATAGAKPARKKAEAGEPSATAGGNGAAGGAATIDPLQWWGALTQQFSEIAASAMKGVAEQTAVAAARSSGGKKPARQAANETAKEAAQEAAAKPAKGAPRKRAAPRKEKTP
ncbi:MAG TPA: PhaM family polyhydroxyalkanoate granule multifunctional regulatory protein, partial [Ramlibacter sp.]|nr:PhaM family polyhydroxyalkanoate granule multifunctional regulatory protein [Ramlibacter sp.]